MSNFNKIVVGIRSSKLSKAQTSLFIDMAKLVREIKNKYTFEIKEIKTSGDIHNTQRLDKIGGKGLFIKEIESALIERSIDIGIHSMKDVPVTDTFPELEIACWMKRGSPWDALISKDGIELKDLKAGSVIGTSSVRRRAQILAYRKDLSIKILRGNIDTRIKKLLANEYDAIILSEAGLERIGQTNLITEVLSHKYFLPAACQGAIGIQAMQGGNFKKIFKSLNDYNTEVESFAERSVLRCINANCNSPVSVFARIHEGEIEIACDIFDHSGSKLFHKTVINKTENFEIISKELGKEILNDLGQSTIDKLNVLENDFNYSP